MGVWDDAEKELKTSSPGAASSSVWDDAASELASQKHNQLFDGVAMDTNSPTFEEDRFVRKMYGDRYGRAAIQSTPEGNIRQYLTERRVATNPTSRPEHTSTGDIQVPANYFNNGQVQPISPEDAGLYVRDRTLTPEVRAKHDEQFRQYYRSLKAKGIDPWNPPPEQSYDQAKPGVDPLTGQPVSNAQGVANAAQKGVVQGATAPGDAAAYLADVTQSAIDWWNGETGRSNGRGANLNFNEARSPLTRFSHDYTQGKQALQGVLPGSAEAAKNPNSFEAYLEQTTEAGTAMATQLALSGGFFKGATPAATVGSQASFMGQMAGQIAKQSSDAAYEQLIKNGENPVDAKRKSLGIGALSAAVQTFINAKLSVAGQVMGTAEKSAANSALMRFAENVGSNVLAGRSSDMADQLIQYSMTGKNPDADRFLSGFVPDLVLGAMFGAKHSMEDRAATQQRVQAGLAVAREGFKQMGLPEANVEKAAQEAVQAYQSNPEGVKLEEIAQKYRASENPADGKPSLPSEVSPSQTPEAPASKLPAKVKQSQVVEENMHEVNPEPAPEPAKPSLADGQSVRVKTFDGEFEGKVIGDNGPTVLIEKPDGKRESFSKARVTPVEGSKLPAGVAQPKVEAPVEQVKAPEPQVKTPEADAARIPLHERPLEEVQAELAKQDQLIQRADQLSKGGTEPVKGQLPNETDLSTGKLPAKVKQQGTKAQQTPEVEAWKKSLAVGMKQDFGGQHPGETPEITIHEPSTPEEQAASAIAQRFGRKLAIFSDNWGDVGGGVMDNHPNVIGIRKGGSQPVLAVLGHELTHTFKRGLGRGEIFDQVKEAISKHAPDAIKKGMDKYIDSAEHSGAEQLVEKLKKDSALHEEEGVAMVMMEAFQNREFWSRFAEADPTLFQTVKKAVIDFVRKVEQMFFRPTENLALPKEGMREMADLLSRIDEATGTFKKEVKSEPEFKSEPDGKRQYASSDEAANAPAKPEPKLPGRVLKTEPTKPVSEAEKQETTKALPQKVTSDEARANTYFDYAMKNGEYHPDMVKEMGGSDNKTVEAYRQTLVKSAVDGDKAAQVKLANTMLPAIKSLAAKVLGPRTKTGMPDAIQAGLAEVQRFIAGTETRQQKGESADAYGARKGKSPLASWTPEKGEVYSLLFNSLKSSLIRHLEDTYGHNITTEEQGAKERGFARDAEGNVKMDKAELGRAHTELRDDEASRGNLPKDFEELAPASRENLTKTLKEKFNAAMTGSLGDEGVGVKFEGKKQTGEPSDSPDRVHGWRSPSGKKFVVYKDSQGWHYADYGAWAEGEPNWDTVTSKRHAEPFGKFEQAWKDGKMTSPINDVAEVLNSKFDAGKVNAIYIPKDMKDDGTVVFKRQPVEERADGNWIGRTLKTNLEDVAKVADATLAGLKAMKTDLDAIFRPAARSEAAMRAAGLLREKGADLAQKRDRAVTALAGARKLFKKMPESDIHQFIDNMEHGRPQASKELQATSDALRSILDKKRDEIVALGKGHFKSFNANYFPHIWEKPGIFGALTGKRPLEGSKAFLKARKYDTFSDGLKAGLTPVSDNPVDLVLLKMHEMDRYIMAHQTFKELKGMGYIKFKKDVGPMPPGFASIDDRIVKRYIKPPFKGATTKVGEWVAMEHVANVFNNYLSPGLRDKPWFRGYLTVGNMMNQAQLGLSFFHVLNTAIDTTTGKLSIALKYLADGKVKEAAKEGGKAMILPLAAADNIIKGNKILQEWKKPGASGDPFIAQIVDAMKAAGGRSSMDQFYKTDLPEKMAKEFNRGNYLGALLRAPGAATELFAKPVMEWWVPRLKMGAFMDMAKYELARLPAGASREKVREVMGKAWDSVDNRMGELVYDNLFWNKAAKDMAMASMRSVGWNLGTVREMLGGVKDAGQLAKKMVGVKSANKAEFTHRMAYLVAMPAMAAMMGGATQYVLSKAQGNNEDATPKEWKDWFFPRTGELDRDGNPVRLALPTYMKDVLAYANNPVETASNKTHPLLNTIIEMLQNKDYYNTKIRNEDDPIYKQAASLLAHFGKQFEPFSSREVRRMMDEGQTGGRQFLPLIGFVRARHDITDSPALHLAKSLVEDNMPRGTRTSEEADKAKSKTDIVRKIRANSSDTDQAIEEGISTGLITQRSQLKEMYDKAEHSTLWGLVRHLEVADAMKVMEAATAKERADLIDGVWQKLQDNKSLTPEEKDKYAEMLDAFERKK